MKGFVRKFSGKLGNVHMKRYHEEGEVRVKQKPFVPHKNGGFAI